MRHLHPRGEVAQGGSLESQGDLEKVCTLLRSQSFEALGQTEEITLNHAGRSRILLGADFPPEHGRVLDALRPPCMRYGRYASRWLPNRYCARSGLGWHSH